MEIDKIKHIERKKKDNYQEISERKPLGNRENETISIRVEDKDRDRMSTIVSNQNIGKDTIDNKDNLLNSRFNIISCKLGSQTGLRKFESFIIDTGAEVSLITLDTVLQIGGTINLTKISTLHAIIDAIVRTLGESMLLIESDHENSIIQSFQVIENHFPIPTNGILRCDFLQNNEGIINFKIH